MTSPMCYRCGNEVPDDPRFAVTEDESREFPELRTGAMLCLMCWNETKWPHLTRPPDAEPFGDIPEEDW